MNRDDPVLSVVLPLSTVAVSLTLGLGLGWPAWLWLPLAVVLLCASLVLARRIRHRHHQHHLRSLYQQQQEVPRMRHVDDSTIIPETPLPSAVADYQFLFSARVFWRPTGNAQHHANLGAVAADLILRRARAITVQEHPSDPVLAQHKLSAALGAMIQDPAGQLATWADSVGVQIPEEDARRLRQLADIRKQQEVWEHERALERNVRAYLGNDVLASAGSALVWWLSRDTSKVEETVQMIGTFAQLSAAANNREVPELFRHLVASPAGHGWAQANGNGEYQYGAAASTPAPLALNGEPRVVDGHVDEPVVTRPEPEQALLDKHFPDPEDPRRPLFEAQLTQLLKRYTAEPEEPEATDDAEPEDEPAPDPHQNGSARPENGALFPHPPTE
ncbi:hypothetical protein LX15_004690 [Streptoalloteichus tenebrarius]|uniref:Uncharacterized protein n=1 Tax=Streptoalloteichus tenebrarius (strain ATCC 17920 / DSM 40477 / JCM 4838 / CBS 697.72 / NBRC 16177 / NCIMB 11028 / NRRL B-12390 / A12253. 1 / ISP 5477) TaxID=1933 RepID=A0ABT1HZP8_STRSD|nr:hypothetical protein [Streptoalloteichus tenebrarius]MCP2260970.1 hypothetical protein [Streptoalloteichus tenebrarius]BFE98908.1 hypothetical protein GCM10020241_05840 [Streptoalloteichus tenebrarius]